MNSLDTNILVYAADEDSVEHKAARTVVEKMLANPEEWILADQVLFEFYRALRNSHIFRHPLDARGAASRMEFLYSKSGVARCCYELGYWESIYPLLANRKTPAARTHDIVLGITLKLNGVKCFFTRNTKDFKAIGFSQLLNPIDAAH